MMWVEVVWKKAVVMYGDEQKMVRKVGCRGRVKEKRKKMREKDGFKKEIEGEFYEMGGGVSCVWLEENE